MTYIVWVENMSVGISTFDEEHKIMFDMINDFYNNIKKRPNSENIDKLFNDIKTFATNHFESEEKLMIKYDYPEYESHKEEHEQFMLKIEEIGEKLRNKRLILSFDITNYIKQWITTHVDTIDKRYCEFLIKKGITSYLN